MKSHHTHIGRYWTISDLFWSDKGHIHENIIAIYGEHFGGPRKVNKGSELL